MKKWLLPITLLGMFICEILRIYFIMPFPGSQADNTLGIAYFMARNIWWLRILFYLIVIWQSYRLIAQKKYWKIVITTVIVGIYALITYYFNVKLNADNMFRQSEQTVFLPSSTNKVNAGKLVIGVAVNGEAKAFPIELIAYHHQVKDVIGGMQVLVTYCSICRSGRVYDPSVDGTELHFKLVGIDHFNAVFEDDKTKSWWRQATGEAIAGPLKGTTLTEVTSNQMPLKRWLELYPESLIMQPDSQFLKQYDGLIGFDEGTIKSELEHRDNAPWQTKSWVVSVEVNQEAKAFDWTTLTEKRLLSETVGGKSIIVILENDLQTFHAFETTVPANGFEMDVTGLFMVDKATQSKWDLNGNCTEGALKGNKLKSVPAYQEFYHAFEEFRK
jgi:hypothetical protein